MHRSQRALDSGDRYDYTDSGADISDDIASALPANVIVPATVDCDGDDDDDDVSSDVSGDSSSSSRSRDDVNVDESSESERRMVSQMALEELRVTLQEVVRSGFTEAARPSS